MALLKYVVFREYHMCYYVSRIVRPVVPNLGAAAPLGVLEKF